MTYGSAMSRSVSFMMRFGRAILTANRELGLIEGWQRKWRSCSLCDKMGGLVVYRASSRSWRSLFSCNKAGQSGQGHAAEGQSAAGCLCVCGGRRAGAMDAVCTGWYRVKRGKKESRQDPETTRRQDDREKLGGGMVAEAEFPCFASSRYAPDKAAVGSVAMMAGEVPPTQIGRGCTLQPSQGRYLDVSQAYRLTTLAPGWEIAASSSLTSRLHP